MIVSTLRMLGFNAQVNHVVRSIHLQNAIKIGNNMHVMTTKFVIINRYTNPSSQTG